jgi:AraC-like DNA-binding protein
MSKSDVQGELQTSLGSLLTTCQEGSFNQSTDFGTFFCSVENFPHFTVLRRHFETDGAPLGIPFSLEEPSLQMIFSLDGLSVFNRRSDPFILAPGSHCINFFNRFTCSNVLDEKARQNDITFRLTKGFYSDLLEGYLCTTEDRLPKLIMQQQEVNTINQHIKADAGIAGLLQNIIHCPFQGDMKTAFVREHIRALLSLQLYYFGQVMTGTAPRRDGKITKRDEVVLYEVRDYIDQHFLNPASVQSLSKRFGLNEFKLKHGFRVLFDTSPIRYLQFKRLDFSRMLLRDTDKTIKEIADEIGYNHAANFTTAFVRAFGKSPAEHRKI